MDSRSAKKPNRKAQISSRCAVRIAGGVSWAHHKCPRHWPGLKGVVAMSRIRLIVLSLATVLAVSALATASASAETFGGVQCQQRPDGHGHWKDSKCTEPGSNFEYETQEITNATVEGEGATAILKSEIGTTKIYIDCQKTTFTGKLETQGKSSSTIKYEECKLYEEATGKVISNCKVENITATVLDKLIGTTGAIEDEFEPKEGGEFTKITITGTSCVLKGTFPVKGTQRCSLPNAEAHLVEHEINCKESGSNLEFGGKRATYRGIVQVIRAILRLLWWLAKHQ
jgi:hypothetical protein